MARNEASRIDLIALWRLLWRYKFLIGGLSLALGVTMAIVSLLMTPVFRAETVVTETREGPMSGASSLMNQFGGLASLAGVNLAADGGAAQEAQAVLESRKLVEEFIRREKLVEVILPDSDKEQQTLWFAVERFQDRVLTIRNEKMTGRTTIAIDWEDPEIAARWANGFVALANELMRTKALSEAQRNISFLNTQIARTNVIEVQKVMFNLVETETKTLMLASGRLEYAFTIVDPAVKPEQRTSPKRTVMTLLGLVFGMLLGTGIAFILDLRSRGVRIGEPEL